MKQIITTGGGDFQRTYNLMEATGKMEIRTFQAVDYNSWYMNQIIEDNPTAKINKPYKAWHGGLIVDIEIQEPEYIVIATSTTHKGILMAQKRYNKTK